MKTKVIIGVILFVILFLGEIAMTFSFKRGNENSSPNKDITPISHILTNDLSTLENTAQVDSIFTEFMSRKKIKGASVAVTYKGRLVYAKGFGYANESEKIQVEPKSLFRIASVSKLITAVGIMKLYEEGQLDIYAPVFGPNGILHDSIFLNYEDRRMENITVYHLLNHTAGWNSRKYDPVFNSLYVAQKLRVMAPASVDQVINFTLQKSLDYKPGSTYCYSNFGYVVLGRVIQEVSGMNYEEYIKFAVLQPLGIYDMHIGKSYFSDKLQNEVTYYELGRESRCYAYDGSGQMVPYTYGGTDIELLGAAGGWVASAPELIRLIVSIDGYTSKPDILKEETIKLMSEAKKATRKLLGWRGTDGYGRWWRTGTLAGTSALVMRNRNEINWVVLLNTSTRRKSKIHNEISRTMFNVMRKVDEWPEIDLFNYITINSEKKLANIDK